MKFTNQFCHCHQPFLAIIPALLVRKGGKTVFFPLAEDAAILCKSPPGEGNGDVGAERRNPPGARASPCKPSMTIMHILNPLFFSQSTSFTY